MILLQDWVYCRTEFTASFHSIMCFGIQVPQCVYYTTGRTAFHNLVKQYASINHINCFWKSTKHTKSDSPIIFCRCTKPRRISILSDVLLPPINHPLNLSAFPVHSFANVNRLYTAISNIFFYNREDCNSSVIFHEVTLPRFKDNRLKAFLPLIRETPVFYYVM